MKKPTLVLFCLLFAFLGFSWLSKSRIHPLPTGKAKGVLAERSEQSGCTDRLIVNGSDKTEYQVVRNLGEYHKILNPCSAIATEVGAVHYMKNMHVRNVRREVYASFGGDTNKIGYNSNIMNPLIPEAVLSQRQAVVCIEGRSGDQDVQSSGFFVDRTGLILSTTHDLEALEGIEIGMHDGSSLPGRLLKVDREKDLSLVMVDAGPQIIVSLAEGREILHQGEGVYSIGCPNNIIGTVFSGTVNGPPRRMDQQPLWQVDLRLHPGSSGSPVFDGRGRLVGVVRARIRGTENIGFLIPLQTILSFVKEP